MAGQREQVLELPPGRLEVAGEPSAEVVEDALAVRRLGELRGELRTHHDPVAQAGHGGGDVDGLDHLGVVDDVLLRVVQEPADHLPGVGVLLVGDAGVVEPGPGALAGITTDDVHLRTRPVDQTLQGGDEDLDVCGGVAPHEERVEPIGTRERRKLLVPRPRDAVVARGGCDRDRTATDQAVSERTRQDRSAGHAETVHLPHSSRRKQHTTEREGDGRPARSRGREMDEGNLAGRSSRHKTVRCARRHDENSSG